MNKLRMRFSKTGRAIYISHLDLMATMQRAFSRAGSRLKYSEGFNPRPQISIALPLSVGCSSVCELMDFQLLEEQVDITALKDRLNATMPEGIEVQEIYEPTRKNAELKWLRIEGVFEYDDRPVDIMREKLQDFFSDLKLSVKQKNRTWLLCDADQPEEIIWVIGLRISDKYKITPDTARVAEIQIENP